MTARRRQKEATSNRVLEAARRLFESVGYEATTVRAIATEAGVSVGSVFTTYESKSEILEQIMGEQVHAFYQELGRLAPGLRGSTADRLRSLFTIHFGAFSGNAPLFFAYISAVYSQQRPEALAAFGRSGPFRAILRTCLMDGQARGEVDAASNLSSVVELLIAAFFWTYRLAAAPGADLDALRAEMDQHIDLVIRSVAAPVVRLG